MGESCEESEVRVRVRAWIEWDGASMLGPGRLELLDLIVEHGSISAAARQMGVSYRAAWRWVAELNDAAGGPLVETATGGAGGGGAHLTKRGKRVMRAADLLQRRLQRFGDRVEKEVRSMLEEA
ncbi:MAG: LysR family transcriptional regulator [Deltaproteobacteria bacterium]|nr:LysR family transcriptional regulator [Deltaproteobacteria bacterium]